jgi:mannose-1-phosphate guanylyltransferase
MAEAIILAGGSGKRLTHFVTRGGPKSMVSVAKPIVLVEEKTRLGRGGGIKNALRNRLTADEEPVVVVNGHIITNLQLEPMLKAHRASGAAVTLLVSQVHNMWGVVHMGENDQVAVYEEKPVQPDLINVGVYVLTPQQKLLLRLPERGDWEDDLLPALAKEGKLRAYRDPSSFWATIDNPRDIFDTEERLQEFIRAGLFGPRAC